MASKDFSITPKQRDYLRMALTGTIYSGGMFGGQDVVRTMVNRGWLRRYSHHPSQSKLYEITDLGRTVARQLGITPESVKP